MRFDRQQIIIPISGVIKSTPISAPKSPPPSASSYSSSRRKPQSPIVTSSPPRHPLISQCNPDPGPGNYTHHQIAVPAVHVLTFRSGVTDEGSLQQLLLSSLYPRALSGQNSNARGEKQIEHTLATTR